LNLEGLEGVKAIADDIIIWRDGNTSEDASASHDQPEPVADMEYHEPVLLMEHLRRAS